jgi:hypothetical protein
VQFYRRFFKKKSFELPKQQEGPKNIILLKKKRICLTQYKKIRFFSPFLLVLSKFNFSKTVWNFLAQISCRARWALFIHVKISQKNVARFLTYRHLTSAESTRFRSFCWKILYSKVPDNKLLKSASRTFWCALSNETTFRQINQADWKNFIF